MKQVVLYTLKTCPACIKLREHLDRQGIEYEDRVIDDNPKYLKEARKQADTVPIALYPDGRVEVGFQGMPG